MVRYIKCPRCELNYIDGDKQEYCDVCLKELKGLPTDLDEIEEAEEEVPSELCPVCGENMMLPGEKMCEECRKKAEYEQEEPDPEEDDEWREYLDDDTDAELDSEMGAMDEAFGEELGELDAEEEEFQDESEEPEEEEDLEYVTGDEIYTLSGDDDDDDNDEEGDDF